MKLRQMPAMPRLLRRPARLRAAAAAASGLLLLVWAWPMAARSPAANGGPATAPQSMAACAQLLGFPRVALMFLTRGDMPHEQLWSDWFGDAAGQLPLQYVQGSSEGRIQQIRQQCGIRARAPVLDRQLLFTVYLHPHRDYPGYQPDSVFHGHDVADRIPALWGHPSLMDATQVLLRAALLDSTNQQFLLLSETCIPLYPPALLYQQLVGETKSRIRTCRGIYPVGQDEWAPELAEPGTNMTHKHWRKSPQWFGLLRPHAQIIASDDYYIELFRQHCVARRLVKGKWRVCFSDEHYIPTVLARWGLDDETDCFGTLVSGNWSSGEGHPHSYKPDEVTADLLIGLRQDVWFGMYPEPGGAGPRELGPARDQCHSDQALELAVKGFIHLDSLESCGLGYAWDPSLLASQCPLFARKFKADTVQAALAAVHDCQRPTHILSLCGTGTTV